MKRKHKGIILLAIGFYLFFVNTVITLFLPVHPPQIPTPYESEPEPLDPITYWNCWFFQQGWQTIIVAIIGLIIIIVGSRYLVIKDNKILRY